MKVCEGLFRLRVPQVRSASVAAMSLDPRFQGNFNYGSQPRNTWKTSRPADTQVQYGTTSSYALTSGLDASF